MEGPLRLLLDATALRNFTTGVETYSLNLIEQLLQSEHKEGLTLEIIVQSDLAQDHRLFAITAGYSNVHIVRRSIPAIGPKRDLNYLMHYPRLHSGYDVYHCLSSNLPLAIRHRAVVTIHDLKYLRYPHYLGRAKRLKARYLDMTFRHAARSAAHIIAVSESTRHDFLQRYGAIMRRRSAHTDARTSASANPRISVIHEAAAITASDGPALSAPSREGPPYFLYVGELRPHKNIERLTAAYELLRRKHAIEVDLRIAGRPHAGFKLPSAGVQFLGPVAHESLPKLYTNALAFCLVSNYEGFGIPILEAMHYGAPVLTSNRSSMPEVAGDAALLVDPEDTEAIAHALWRLYSDDALRTELRRRGRARAQQFSWQQAARATLQIYRSVAGQLVEREDSAESHRRA